MGELDHLLTSNREWAGRVERALEPSCRWPD
jgi:hypothetical protein